MSSRSCCSRASTRGGAPTATEELIRGPYAPRFRFQLLDLSHADDAGLGAVGARRSALLLLKYARGARGPARAAAVPGDVELSEATSRDDPPTGGFVAMEVTLGPELREEAEGWGTRRERLAREAGRDEGAIGVLLTLLAARFGPLTASTEQQRRA